MENLKSLTSARRNALREYETAFAEYNSIPDRREVEKEIALYSMRVAYRRYMDARSAITRFQNAAYAVNAPRAK